MLKETTALPNVKPEANGAETAEILRKLAPHPKEQPLFHPQTREGVLNIHTVPEKKPMYFQPLCYI